MDVRPAVPARAVLLRLLRSVWVALVVCGVTLLFVEAGWRCFDRMQGQSSEAGLYYMGDDGVHHYTAGYAGVHTRPGIFSVAVHTDAHGYRTSDYPPDEAPLKQEAVEQVLLVGDSFFYGWGVKFGETVGARLEYQLPAVRVYNGAVSGYGPIEASTVYPALVNRLRPDWTIYGFFVGNDIRDTLLQHQHDILNGRLVRRYSTLRAFGGAYQPSLHTFQFDQPRPVAAARQIVPNMINHCLSCCTLLEATGCYPATDDLFSIYAFPVYSLKRIPDAFRGALALAVRRLKTMRDLTVAQGGEFVVALIPYKGQLDPERLRELLEEGGAAWNDFDMEQPQSRIASLLRLAGIPHIDLRPGFVEAWKYRQDLYMDGDGHWSAEGHGVAAHLLRQYLEEHDFRVLEGTGVPGNAPAGTVATPVPGWMREDSPLGD